MQSDAGRCATGTAFLFLFFCFVFCFCGPPAMREGPLSFRVGNFPENTNISCLGGKYREKLGNMSKYWETPENTWSIPEKYTIWWKCNFNN